MGRKVFISALGATDYGECDYKKDGESYGKVRFIQEATLNYLTRKEPWCGEDCAILLITKGAETANWIDNGHIDKKSGIKKNQEGLQSRLLKFPIKLNPIKNLPDGNNEEEIWDIFVRTFNEIKEDDELYFDMTHGYRYIPMLILVLSNYAKFLKKVTVKSLTYGNYEISERGAKPGLIIDLLPLSALQDWTSAADQYLTTGSVDKLRSLYLPIIESKLKDSFGKDETAQKMRGFIIHLDSVIKDRLTCQGREIIKSDVLCKVLEDLENLQDVPMPEPFKPLLDEFSKSIRNFDKSENIKNGLQAAKWCFKNGLYQQCVTLLQETIVCYICESASIDWTDLTNRDTVNSAFAIVCMNIRENKWNLKGESDKEKDDNKQLIKDLIKNNLLLLIKNEYSVLSEIRNQYNHAGMLCNVQFTASSMIDKINIIVAKISDKLEYYVDKSN
jgi:CRISPR-associated Csx2 family protein